MLFLMRLLAFLGILWLLRRVLALFAGGRGARTVPPRADKAASTNTVKDPVCGMYMDPRLALRLEDRGNDVFFCSETCRQKYVDLHMGRS